jgi:hypothetical protein
LATIVAGMALLVLAGAAFAFKTRFFVPISPSPIVRLLTDNTHSAAAIFTVFEQVLYK